MTDLRGPLRDLFGFDDFRAGQEPVVRAAVEGRDTLALMPTGSGKSLTYQLAAMLRTRPTLVLSPLIALMKDQVDGLPPAVARVATFVNSSLPADEVRARLQRVAAGQTRLLYAAPERLRQAAFVETLRSVGLGLVVIDEAHCVSMWGHDFRPDYLFIRTALEALDNPVMLGLTATATPDTATEIAVALGRAPEVVRTSVARPNLRYDVETADNAETRLGILLDRLADLRGASSIVYARSRRACESLARVLRSHGFPIDHYHAGLEPEERTRIQDAFVAGELQGVVATTAFGMGIDKPDVRLVCLVNYPDSLESYVQMVGRAGRDGEPSDTLLLAGPHDASALRRFALSDVPTAADLRRVYAALRTGCGRADPEELAAAAPDRDPRVLVGLLEQAGLLTRSYDDGRLIVTELVESPPAAGTRVEMLLERARVAAKARADRIVQFAESRRCRHAQVAEHFGEHLPVACGACDICAPRRPGRSGARVSKPLPDDVGAAIVEAVRGLTWPLGRRSLIAMLRGSVSAPPSARRSPSYGILSCATEADASRWLRVLEQAGALRVTVTDDGFRVLTATPGVSVPRIGSAARHHPDTGLAARLRAWRRERASTDGVPAFVVLHDSTLTELAASRPTTLVELSGVRGVGPAKLERYGEELLAVVAAGEVTPARR